MRYASVSILVIHYHSNCWYRTVILSYLSNILFQRLKVIQYFCNHIILRLKKKEKEIAPFVEEARTDDSFGDIDAWTCPSESVVGGGSLARSRTSPAMVALLLFFFRWVNSTSPWHYLRNALNTSSSFFFILTVIYIQYLRTDMKLRHGNFRRRRSESFRISNLPPQMKKVSIGGR